MREVRHENLSQFVGACVDTNNICILTNYCARGSLEDVLYNPDLCLDPIFISSLVSDILKVIGMQSLEMCVKMRLCFTGVDIFTRQRGDFTRQFEDKQLPGGQPLGAADFRLWIARI
jgi:Protein tyrosine and serine/threonine kinase